MLDSAGTAAVAAARKARAKAARACTTDGRFATPDGRAALCRPGLAGTAEPRDARYPVSLTTGRLRDQWHGMSRTGTLGRLFAHAPEPAVELHPQELARRRWPAGRAGARASRRGSWCCRCGQRRRARRRRPSSPCTGAPEWLGGPTHRRQRADLAGALLPAVEAARAEARRGALERPSCPGSWSPRPGCRPPGAGAAQQLRALFAEHWAYASCVPFGREPAGRVGLLFLRPAPHVPADARRAQSRRWRRCWAWPTAPLLRYADARAGRERAMQLAPTARCAPSCWPATPLPRPWVLDLLQAACPRRRWDAPAGWQRAAAAGRPPAARRSATACHDVSQARIVETLQLCRRCRGAPAPAAGQLRCGTECGSCLPALKVLVQRPTVARPRTSPPEEAAAA
jgi:assimilatory nitrate reductase catalytic subunit